MGKDQTSTWPSMATRDLHTETCQPDPDGRDGRSMICWRHYTTTLLRRCHGLADTTMKSTTFDGGGTVTLTGIPGSTSDGQPSQTSTSNSREHIKTSMAFGMIYDAALEACLTCPVGELAGEAKAIPIRCHSKASRLPRQLSWYDSQTFAPSSCVLEFFLRAEGLTA